MDGRQRLLQITARSVAAGVLPGKSVVRRIWRSCCRWDRSLKSRVGAVNQPGSAAAADLERQLAGQLPRQGGAGAAGGRKVGAVGTNSRGRVRGWHLNGNRGRNGFSWDPLYQHRGMPRELKRKKKIRDLGVRPGFRAAVDSQVLDFLHGSGHQCLLGWLFSREGPQRNSGAKAAVTLANTAATGRIGACWTNVNGGRSRRSSGNFRFGYHRRGPSFRRSASFDSGTFGE